MAQIQSPSCIAMALALKDVQAYKITVAELGLASDGASIMAPFLGDQKLILNLTPLEDDWLPITAANLEALPHHEGESAQSLHMVVKLSDADVEYLNKVDAAIRGASGFKPTRDRVIWKSLQSIFQQLHSLVVRLERSSLKNSTSGGQGQFSILRQTRRLIHNRLECRVQISLLHSGFVAKLHAFKSLHKKNWRGNTLRIQLFAIHNSGIKLPIRFQSKILLIATL